MHNSLESIRRMNQISQLNVMNGMSYLTAGAISVIIDDFYEILSARLNVDILAFRWNQLPIATIG